MLLTAYNWLPSKSFCCLRLTIGFPKKVSTVDGLQLAFLEKFALSTVYNSLYSKSKRCLQLTMAFPEKGFSVDGLQSFFL